MEGDRAHGIRSSSGDKYRAWAVRIGLGQAFRQDFGHRPLAPQRERAGELLLQTGRLGALRLSAAAVAVVGVIIPSSG